MDYPVLLGAKKVGTCRLEEDGLYWVLDCSCQAPGEAVRRLYAGGKSLGVLEKRGETLLLHRRISRTAAPQLPPESCFTLTPETEGIRVKDYVLFGRREGESLVFPYDPEKPCPCEPLICFFRVQDGLWQLNPGEIPGQ